MKIKPIVSQTSKQYVANGGVRCPKCMSLHITGGAIGYSVGALKLSVSCNICESKWEELYKLTGYINLTVDTPPKV